MSNINSTLKFENYIVENIEFKANFECSGDKYDIEFDFDSEYSIEENKFILHLETVIFPEAIKNDYPFTMRVKIAGLFEIDPNIDEKTKKSFIEKNSVAILFPYLRALVSVYTSNANVGNFMLPPINVVKYLENKRKNKD
ncbi:hypothetical protein FC758_12325 [Clostridium botulinum]|nr:hypothetical protein [Clostridium botulinum]NFL58320.1 hypothetical protein [Clostridium botulinum]NFL62590.1 hypothetical protein [Clostridium botulinum]